MEQLLINNGFVKLPRSILNWEWYDHPDVSRMYIHLILKVNYAPAKWRGLEILEGEHITSINKLSIELLMSEFKVRESLTKLKNTNYIEITTTNKFTIVKLIKSRLFENEKNTNHNQIKNEPTMKLKTNQKQTTTNNNNKELIEIENLVLNYILVGRPETKAIKTSFEISTETSELALAVDQLK